VTTAQKQTYAETPTKVVGTSGGLDYAYRDAGSGTVPLVLLHHFRGNLDNWDPALIDALASHRRVVAFDNVGVGGTKGTTPNTVEQMATDAISFLEAMEFDRVDILGFSIGSFVASSQQAGQQALQRMFTKASGFDEPTTWQTRQAQYDAVCCWGIPNHALLQRLSAISHRVFIANGESDPMILPHFSYLLAGLIPGAKVKIYPDSAHGFLFQHHAEFAPDVEQFLCSSGGPDE
jgi:pimeloyl-ACP methyl ester carboxylesterase